MTKYETLKNALEKRIAKSSADEKLPGEIELSKEYSVSRMTVNKVITKLAEEGLVYRRKKAGTFVTGSGQRGETIYILTPCPDFLEQPTLGASVYWRLINCLHTVTLGKTVPIILVAISQTNDENDIDEKNLELIKPGGTVVCFGTWYRKTFPWLFKRKCNVIYINNQIAEDILDFSDKWHYITLDSRQAAADTIKLLKEHGRRTPAFISMLYHNKSTKLLHPFVDGWKRGMDSFYPYLDQEQRQIKFYPEEDSDEQLTANINRFLEQNSCDALFVSSAAILEICWKVLKKRGLKVPEDIVLITTNNEQCIDYPAAYFDFPIFQIAEDILDICNGPEGRKKFINAKFHCLDYLKKDSEINNPRSSVHKKTRNFRFEMTHI
jgi:DNA-binding LacI/PurR family transcriptional regulator